MKSQTQNPSEVSGHDSSEFLKSSTKHLKGVGDDLIAASGAKIEELKHAAIQQGQEYVASVQERLKGWQGETEAFARKKPLRALATAAGVGFVLGIVFRR